MSAITNKIRVFHAVLHRCGVLQSKADIIAAYGVESTKELTEPQLDELISRFDGVMREKHKAAPQLRQWRSNVLVELNKCGVYGNNGDWTRVNTFLLNARVAGKLLYEMNTDELKKLHKKLKVIAHKKRTERANQLHHNIEMN